MPLSTPAASSAVDPVEQKAIFVDGQWGSLCGVTSFVGMGLLDTGNITSVDSSAVGAEDENGRFIAQATAAPLNNPAQWTMTGSIFRLDQFPLMVSKFRLPSVADIRFYAGFGETGTTTIGNDNLGGPGVGVQFSTSRPDTNFQFLAHDGATQTLVDSGLVPGTDPFFVQVDATALNDVTVRIRDENFVTLAENTFETTNPVLPVETVDMAPLCGIRNRVAVSKTIDQFYTTVLMRNA